MTDRTDKGYYCCKVKDEQLYNDFINAHKKHTTLEQLAMLQHDKSTQPNESMNHSVAAIAPKNKTFSKSSSLLTRVMLCAGAQIIGHHELWNRIFMKFDLKLDENLSRYLMKRDENKSKRQIFQATKIYKSYRSKKRYDKYAEAHADQLEEVKTGAQYESGVALKTAKKTLKSAPKRNPPGTLPSEWKCPFYHPDYCQKLGHTGCRNADCHMRTSSKEERDAAVKVIEEEAIAIQMDYIAIEGKICVINIFSPFIHNVRTILI